jgi:uncharacterized repeat protein (TIGR03803 family)
MPNRLRILFWTIAFSFAITLPAAIFVVPARAASESVLHSFPGGTDGYLVNGGLTVDSKGNLYGVTYYGGDGLTTGQYNSNGVVYRITPPSTETVLYRFQPTGDGSNPVGKLLLGKSNVLYGATSYGGSNYGTIFSLTPPKKPTEPWVEKVLWSFNADGDGLVPTGTLIEDKNGALYGTTSNGGANGAGTVFMLSPPAPGHTDWTETLLYQFTNGDDGNTPTDGLVMDSDGNLYGTAGGGANGDGVVFEIVKPTSGSIWTEKTLWAFAGGSDGQTPNGELVYKSSALYGTTQWGGGGACAGAPSDGIPAGCGTVFKLSPPKTGHTAWTEEILWAFGGYPTDGYEPTGGVQISSSGDVYGTTFWGGDIECTSSPGAVGCGTAFRLAPPPHGGSTWSETLLWQFESSGYGDAWLPQYGILLNKAATELFGTAAGGATGDTAGSVFEITP